VDSYRRKGQCHSRCGTTATRKGRQLSPCELVSDAESVFALVVQSELLLAATEMEDETHDAVVWSWRKESRHSRINAVGGQGAGSSAQVSI
jgi:hypothetical protein